MTPKPRIVGLESEDRRTDNPAVSSGEVNGPPPKRNRDDQRRAREAGFDVHLTKPFDPEQLLELLARHPDAGPAQPAS